METAILEKPATATLPFTKEEVLKDYKLACLSRQASLLGRREVLTGKAKFGIFGDGKELAQIAMAKSWQKGDIRSGYYRDQTLMFALGISDVQKFFAQLYSDINLENEPASGGRQMNGHFASRMLDADGNWLNLTEDFHTSADCSPTASQMPRLAGLAYASKLYRQLPELHSFTQFSKNGNEVAFGTIGDASSSEGLFWETMNAIGVLQAPLVMSVWDDGYGISVPISYQTTKESISTLLSGFQPEDGKPGVTIYKVKGWDFPALCETYRKAVEKTRRDHTPCLVHVVEVTQPQGHSTSGSHERYKSKERLEWEKEYDCINQFKIWILENGLAEEAELNELESQAKKEVSQAKASAWSNYLNPIKAEIAELGGILENLAAKSAKGNEIRSIKQELEKISEPFRKDLHVAARKVLTLTVKENLPERAQILNWKKKADAAGADYFNSHLLSETRESAMNIAEVKPVYAPDAPVVDGREVLQANFDEIFKRDPRVLAFGEDVGFLGDVNQAFAGLQQKYGELRVTDAGIREATIIGQGIGLAMRGLRPIAEIQYLDYLLYAAQIISDDLCTLRYRTKGGQKAPLIVRTRGHRLEGVWHSGSPMGMIINAFRGMHVLVPRDMTRAAGFYNTMLRSDDPALIIEVLNGYRLKETLPSNLADFTIPLGVPEVLRTGSDLTLVTYGPNCRIAAEAAEELAKLGIEIEIIDVQTLLPFDRYGKIVESLKKTNRLLVLDEDVPGGASAYILQQILEVQNGYRYLDSAPRTLTSHAHRPAYATDGDYFSKPNVEQILDVVCQMMHEFDPKRFSLLF